MSRWGLYTSPFSIHIGLLVKLIHLCILTAALLLNSCGIPVSTTQRYSERETAPEEEQPSRWQKRAGQSAVVISSALVVSCLLIARVRKLCARVVTPQQTKNTRVDEKLLSILEAQRHRDAEVAQLQEELATLSKEYKEYRSFLDVGVGKQAYINGFIFENETVHALYKIIPDLYEGEQVKKIVRNVDGYFSKTDGKNKDFEIDAIVITAERVFVIETKIKIKKRDVDRLVMLLENFHQLKFSNNNLHRLLRGKHVHGGFSYLFDAKIEKKGERVRKVAKYAQHHKLLTIHRLHSQRSTPSRVGKLRYFRQRK